ncbi:MAG TPA: CaiB/BaiF CoA-transferase family protein [Gemmatimonadota bacterium]|nr:CaiB/BaiF CoA-transferase family protein [Gemmatimonadota bacterium]
MTEGATAVSGPTSGLPLIGARVIDLTHILAGPFATMLLADLGADVVKVERPDGGDETRAWGPPWVEAAAGAAAYFVAVNRNKRSVAIDLRGDEGRAVLWRLVEGSDAVVSNFRPGVMDRLGFSRSTVVARSPRTVYAEINGYGAGGPAAGRPAYDVIVQGETGVMDLTGFPDGPPTRVGITLGDQVAGLYAVQGVLAALLDRQRTGRGGHVEVALHDALLSLLTYHAQGWWAGGPPPSRMGNAHPSIVPYQAFQAADGWLNVGVGNDRQWAGFCAAIGRPRWADDVRWRTNGDRVERRAELVPRLERIFAGRPVSDWLERLGDAAVPCGPIRTVPEALESPESRARGAVTEVAGIPTLAPAVRLNGAGGGLRRPPPGLGEHTAEVLAEAGYVVAEIDALRARGAVAGPGPEVERGTG